MTYGTVGGDAMATSDGYTVAGMYGFKNRIINGAMGIWQRGTGAFTSGYTADRWFIAYGTAVSVSQSADVPASAPFPYSLALTGSNFPTIAQRIESKNCVDLAGQNVTVSFWAKQTAGAGTSSMALQLFYPNAVDNYTGQTQVGSTIYLTGSSSWAYYSYTFTGVSASVANGLAVQILANTAGAAAFLVTGVQVEKGATATTFDFREYGEELRKCQRYYFNCSISEAIAFLDGGTAQYPSLGNMTWPVTMRATPSVAAFTFGAFAYNSGSALVSFTPTGGSNTYYGSNTAGVLLLASISNGQGATQTGKVGYWNNINFSLSAEL